MLFSLLVTAEDMRDQLASAEGIARATDWCRAHSIEKVYLTPCEWERDGTFWQAPAESLRRTIEAYHDAGIEMAGRVGPVHLTRPSTGWPETPCPSDPHLHARARDLFRAACRTFDEVIVDNRLFFDCTCEECDARRNGRSWTQFHQDELNALLKDVVLPALEFNPTAALIWKYPSWHEMIASRGYDLLAQTQLFPATCAGVETRDPDAFARWGGRQPYGAFFTGAYFRAADPRKCRIAWFDSFACDELVWAAQAWGAVLAGFEEIALYSYGSLTGPRRDDEKNYPPPEDLVKALVKMRPRLDLLAALVKEHEPRGVSAYRPPTGDPGHEPYLHDYLGMLGIPVVPSLKVPEHAPAVALAECAVEDADLRRRFRDAAVLATTRYLQSSWINDLENVQVLETHTHCYTDRISRFDDQAIEDTKDLPRADEWFAWPVEQLEALRKPLYAALGLPLMKFPAKIGVFLLGEQFMALANYAKTAVEVELDAKLAWMVDAQGNEYAMGRVLQPESLSLWEIGPFIESCDGTR